MKGVGGEDQSLRSLTAAVGGLTLLLHDHSVWLGSFALIHDSGFDVSVLNKTCLCYGTAIAISGGPPSAWSRSDLNTVTRTFLRLVYVCGSEFSRYHDLPSQPSCTNDITSQKGRVDLWKEQVCYFQEEKNGEFLSFLSESSLL